MTAATAQPNYLATAFYSQYNLILLGGAALFSLASASPLPLLAGVSVELVWLGLGSRLPAFRRRVDERLEAERRGRLDDEVMSGLRTLDSEHTARLLAVSQAISAIGLRVPEGAPDADLRSALVELDRLRPVLVRLCQLHERLSRRLQEMVVDPPEREVARLSQAYAAEKDIGLRLTLHQSIKQAQKKIEQQGRMVELRRGIELKLSLVEQALSHLQSRQQLGAPAQELARDVRSLVAQIGSTAPLEAELQETSPLSAQPGRPVSA